VAHGQKPLKKKECKPQAKETKVSRTDPDGGYLVRDGTFLIQLRLIIRGDGHLFFP
jgi:hypothetical protein